MARRKQTQETAPVAPAPPGPPAGTVAAQVGQMDSMLGSLLSDAEQAQDTWRVLDPLARQVIGLLRTQLDATVASGSVDLVLANRLLGSLTAASKSLSSTATALAGAAARIAEAKTTLSGGRPSRGLDKLSEAQLRQIVAEAVRDIGLGPCLDVTPAKEIQNAEVVA